MKKMNSAEIAKLAGVSRSTVSRVINNYQNVPKATKEKVLKVIEQHNYYPKVYAQALVGKKTGTIVLFMAETGNVSSDSISNFLVTHVIERASDHGFYVLTSIIRDIDNLETRQKIKEVFYQGRVDGGIFIGMKNDEPVIEELASEGFIIGVLDQEAAKSQDFNHITCSYDNFKGTKIAIDYLVSLGHKQIGIVNGDMTRHAGMERYVGFMEAMNQHQLEVNHRWVLEGDFSKNCGELAITKLIEKGESLPTAWLAANDSIAFGIINGLEKFSYKVPEDISVIGIDDHLLSQYCKPPLTTLRVDFKYAMENLTSQVINAIKGRPIDPIADIDMELIIRESCKRI